MTEGWTETTLGEVCEVLDRMRKPITKKDRIAGAIPYYGATGIVDYVEGFLFDEPLVLVGEDGAKWSGGDATAFAVKGKTWVNNHAHVLRPNRIKIIDEWLILWLTYSDLSKYVTGVTVPKLNQKNLRAIVIPLPPIEEQRRILAILDSALAALSSARENLEANLTDSVAVSMGVQEAAIVSQGTLDTLANVLGEVSTGPFGSLLHKSDYIRNGIPIVNPSHIVNGKIIPDKNKTVTIATAKRLSAYQLKSGNVVIGRRGEMGRCAVVTKEQEGWLCGTGSFVIRSKDPALSKFVVMYLSTASSVKKLEAIAGGATMPNLSNKALSNFEFVLPSEKNRMQALEITDEARKLSQVMSDAYQSQLNDIDSLRQSVLQSAFAGGLTQTSTSIAVNDNERDERLSTATLVVAYEKHSLEQRHKTFGHVKAQKTLHLTESVSGLDLGRQPKVRQAGPHDQEHFDRVEAWAAQNEVFSFVQRRTGKRGYDFIRGKNYASFLSEAKTLLADYQAGLSRFLPLITRMNSEEAEIFTTVHAAWNNLLADGKTPSDEDIVWAAREGWHESKMDIARQKFFDAIREIRRNDLEPDGSAKYVHGAQESLL